MSEPSESKKIVIVYLTYWSVIIANTSVLYSAHTKVLTILYIAIKTWFDSMMWTSDNSLTTYILNWIVFSNMRGLHVVVISLGMYRTGPCILISFKLESACVILLTILYFCQLLIYVHHDKFNYRRTMPACNVS